MCNSYPAFPNTKISVVTIIQPATPSILVVSPTLSDCALVNSDWHGGDMLHVTPSLVVFAVYLISAHNGVGVLAGVDVEGILVVQILSDNFAHDVAARII